MNARTHIEGIIERAKQSDSISDRYFGIILQKRMLEIDLLKANDNPREIEDVANKLADNVQTEP